VMTYDYTGEWARKTAFNSPLYPVTDGAPSADASMKGYLAGGIPPEKQIQLALFLASASSNHISGKLLHINDDWRRLERENIRPDLFTLRRVQSFKSEGR